MVGEAFITPTETATSDVCNVLAQITTFSMAIAALQKTAVRPNEIMDDVTVVVVVVMELPA